MNVDIGRTTGATGARDRGRASAGVVIQRVLRRLDASAGARTQEVRLDANANAGRDGRQTTAATRRNREGTTRGDASRARESHRCEEL